MANPHITDIPKFAQRFWNRVDTTTHPDGCWEWQGYRHIRYPHGQICVNDHQRIYTHRFAFFLVHGHWPKMVIHSCDNPPCCNPDHLRAGDAAQNAADMVARNRQTFGERNAQAKITADQVRDIRRRWKFRKVTLKQLGEEHGLAFTSVHAIVQRRNWKHI